MNILNKSTTALISIIILILTSLTLAAIIGWEHTQYLAYTFFISWGVLFVVEILKTRNYHSLLLVGFALGAAGLYFSLRDPQIVEAKTKAALLLGKISLTVFTALLAFRLFRTKEELEKNSTLFLILLGLLAFQVMLSNVKEVDAFSVGGFISYFTVGIIANVLLNGHISRILKKGERAILLAIAVSNLYSISIMLIANFG